MSEILLNNYLSDEQLITIKSIKNMCSSLSFIASIIIMIFYLTLYFKFRYKSYNQKFFTRSLEEDEQKDKLKYNDYKMGICHSLIFYMALSNFFNNISSFLDITFSNGKIVNTQSCLVQAVMSNFFELAGLCCVTLMTITILLAICNLDINSINCIYFYFVLYGMCLPLLFTIG